MRRVRPELGLDVLVGLVGWQHSLAGPELDALVLEHTHTHTHTRTCMSRSVRPGMPRALKTRLCYRETVTWGKQGTFLGNLGPDPRSLVLGKRGCLK